MMIITDDSQLGGDLEEHRKRVEDEIGPPSYFSASIGGRLLRRVVIVGIYAFTGAGGGIEEDYVPRDFGYGLVGKRAA